jgi:hypothetical protein
MFLARLYVLLVLGLGAWLAWRGSRMAARGEIVEGTVGGAVAVGLICLALVVEPPAQ